MTATVTEYASSPVMQGTSYVPYDLTISVMLLMWVLVLVLALLM
jgi:hypothetical protein